MEIRDVVSSVGVDAARSLGGRAASAETRAVGLRVARLLDRACLEPVGRPNSAILIVRSLRDPLPGRVATTREAAQPAHEWERAVRSTLTDWFDRAARPADGPVPLTANAVRFGDEAELMACLARDLLAGDARGRWWWRVFLREGTAQGADAVVAACIEHARAIPAALARLSSHGEGGRFVAALAPRQARALLEALADAYEVPFIAAPVRAPVPLQRLGAEAVPEEQTVPGDEAVPVSTRASSAGRTASETFSGSSPPWLGLIPPLALPSSVDADRHALLGVGLSLWYAPLAVRTRAFREAFGRWRAGELSAASAVAPGAASRVGPRPGSPAGAAPSVTAGVAHGDHESAAEGPRLAVVEPPSTGLATMAIGEEASSTPAAPPIGRDSPRGAVSPGSADVGRPSAPLATGAPPRKGTPVAPRRAGGADGSGVIGPAGGEPAGDEAAPSGVPAAPASPSIRDAEALASRVGSVRTGLGGVFFLINALRRLELFDRLDDHFGVDSSIGGWAWLEILARSLLGRRREDALADPIWDVLAALDGRAPSAPASDGFRGPRAYRLPESWPALPGEAAAASRRRRESPLGLKATVGLRRLLETLVPYLRWRLIKSLSFDTRPPREAEALLVSRLLRRRGEASWTRTHVDLHMGMGQVDIAVRLAGLDANPGWVPALGRVVTFYYD